MGIINNKNNNQTIHLKTVHMFGRDTASDTVLDHPLSSRLHCIIRYQSNNWLITDQSKNGTYLNGKLLSSGKSIKLRLHDKISFPGAEKELWELIDTHPPKPMLIHKSSNRVLILEDTNLLPSQDHAELVLSRETKHWLVERGDSMSIINNGDFLHFNDEQWQLSTNEFLQDTVVQLRQPVLDTSPKLNFSISLCEEHIDLTIKWKEQTWQLGQKAHHYLLLLLAKHRILDEERGVPTKDQGWLVIDTLLYDMNIDSNHLNILIYRARKAIGKLELSTSLIERRSGEIRLNNCDLTLEKGDTQQNYQMASN